MFSLSWVIKGCCHSRARKLVVFIQDEFTDTKNWVRGDIGYEERPDAFLTRIRICGREIAVKEWEFVRLNGFSPILAIVRALDEYFESVAGVLGNSHGAKCESLLRSAKMQLERQFPKAADEIAEALELFSYYREHGSWVGYRDGELYFLRHIGLAVLEVLGL